MVSSDRIEIFNEEKMHELDTHIRRVGQNPDDEEAMDELLLYVAKNISSILYTLKKQQQDLRSPHVPTQSLASCTLVA